MNNFIYYLESNIDSDQEQLSSNRYQRTMPESLWDSVIDAPGICDIFLIEDSA